MNDVCIGTVRLRGSQARRLAAVAAGPLPAALDRALRDLPDVEVPPVSVRLDLDVRQYDDVTLAALWADAVRAEVLAARPTWRRAARPAVSGADVAAGQAPAEAVLAAARRWLTAAGDARRAVPAVLLRLGDPEVARAVAAALGPREWPRLLRALAGALALSPPLPTAADPRSGPGPALAAGAQGGYGAGPGHTGVPPGPGGPVRPDTPQRPSAATAPDGSRATLEVLAALGELTVPGPAILDPATVTRAAGLVLLYPWLAEHCRRAERLHPRLDPLDVREAALAALADPADPGLADDVLVGLLVGRPGPVPRRDRTRMQLTHEAEVRESAAEVLASFVSLLPGFGSSSAPFIWENWIARLGVLDRDRDPALLTAATRPLDVVLPRLPYPVGLLKLPWSPLISVRFRP